MTYKLQPRNEIVDWKKQLVRKGQIVAIYPFSGEPFIGKVKNTCKNKYGRISYFIEGITRQVMAEELYPKPGQKKLKIPYQGNSK